MSTPSDEEVAEVREVHLERLIGRRVLDPEGRSAGIIEEIEAELQAGEWVVTTILTGPVGMMTRLSALGIGGWLLGFLGARKSAGGYRIAWRHIDLTDPAYPRLRCPIGLLDQTAQESRDSLP